MRFFWWGQSSWGLWCPSPGCRGAWPKCKAIYRPLFRQPALCCISGPGCRSRVRTPMTPVGMTSLLEVWTRRADAHSAGAATGPVMANRGYMPGCNYKASSSDRACSAVTRPYKALEREGLCGHRLCLSAPLLQCTKSFWEARMMLPAPPGADRPQQCNQRVQMFRSDSGYV